MLDSTIVWRVNRKPRFPVLSLGEYMLADDGPRETMRRNMKYERISPTILYSKLQRGVASFLASPIRDRKILERCRAELQSDQDTAKTLTAAENAKYALRSLEAFERSLNALPIGGLELALPSRYDPLNIEGVKVSVQPTVLVSVARARGKSLRGAAIIDTAKGIEPKTEEGFRRATGAMGYSAFLLHELVASQIVDDDVRSSPEHCMVFHAHRPELVVSDKNYKRDLRNVEAACRDIAARWANIDPPSSFDPGQAKFRD